MSTEGARRMLDLLERVIPAPHRGTRVLDVALARAGLHELPDTTEELKAFVRTALRTTLEDELGPRLAHEVANDLDAALSPALRRANTWPASPSSRSMRRVSPPPPKPCLSVLIVGADRVTNASLARVLIREGYLVSTAQDHAEMAIASARGVDVVVLDHRCASDPPSPLRELLRSTRTVALRDGETSREVLSALSSLSLS